MFVASQKWLITVAGKIFINANDLQDAEANDKASLFHCMRIVLFNPIKSWDL